MTYAAVLTRTMGWELPQKERSIAFIRRHQQQDGRFINLAGKHDPASDLAVLYNTTQGVVGLRALGAEPEIDPSPPSDGCWPATLTGSFPGTRPASSHSCMRLSASHFRETARQAGADMEASQAADGYLGDHVASTFHMVHFFRLLGEPTPRAESMVARVLRDQRPDGGWNIKEPDWDVHACFDAVFILRQLGGDGPRVKQAITRALWSLGCRNPDGGFGHFPGRPSDMDAVYFQFGTLIQAGRIPGDRPRPSGRPNARLGPRDRARSELWLPLAAMIEPSGESDAGTEKVSCDGKWAFSLNLTDIDSRHLFLPPSDLEPLRAVLGGASRPGHEGFAPATRPVRLGNASPFGRVFRNPKV